MLPDPTCEIVSAHEPAPAEAEVSVAEQVSLKPSVTTTVPVGTVLPDDGLAVKFTETWVVPTSAKLVGKEKPSKLVLVDEMAVVVAVFVAPPDTVSNTVSVTVIFSLSAMSGKVTVSVTEMVSLSVTIAGGGGDVVTPVPERDIVCVKNGPFTELVRLLSPTAALSNSPSAPPNGPKVVGSNCIVKMQEVPALMVNGDGRGTGSVTELHTTCE